MTQLPEGISTWLRKHAVVIELILAALVALAFAMKFMGLNGADEVLILAMLTLGGFYFPISFLCLYKSQSQATLVLSQIFSVASAVGTVGLLFTFLKLPGAKEQLTIGLLSMSGCTVITIYLAVTGRAQKFLPVLIRTIVLGGLSLNAWLGLWTPPAH